MSKHHTETEKLIYALMKLPTEGSCKIRVRRTESALAEMFEIARRRKCSKEGKK